MILRTYKKVTHGYCNPCCITCPADLVFRTTFLFYEYSVYPVHRANTSASLASLLDSDPHFDS